MNATNYFRLHGGKTGRGDIFPFIDGERDDTQRAWELAHARAVDPSKVVALRQPKIDGPWTDEIRLVGVVREFDRMPDPKKVFSTHRTFDVRSDRFS